MRLIRRGAKYERDLKRLKKSPRASQLLPEIDRVIGMLALDEPLPAKYCDHDLKGEWKDCRECHIKPDLLLIYEKSDEGELHLLKLERLGSHSELF